MALLLNKTLSKVYAELILIYSPTPILIFRPTVSVLIIDALARIRIDSNITLGKLFIN